ncbi:hypothetical protein ACKVMT_14980 [Halobacteriales archaeon Cl-PHB]
MMEDTMTHDRGPDRPIEVCCGLLSDPVRRHVLYYLRDQQAATQSELADVVSTWLAARDADGAVTATERNSIAVELAHVHLPKLEAAGAIEAIDEGWQWGSVPDVMADLLDTTATHEPPATEPIEVLANSSQVGSEE